jgi:hypothetical protein
VTVRHDLLEETLVLLRDVPKLAIIGPRRGGRRMNIRTGFRWATDGVCGVVLETVVQGGQRYTSVPALERFFAAVTAVKQRKGQGDNVTPARGEKLGRIDVESELDRLGL